jgi:endonuclease III
MQAPDSGQLFQEHLCVDPFWMLVACILINRTHWRQVQPVLANLMAECEGPRDLLRVDPDQLARWLRPLGFQNRRAGLLRRFALAWQDCEPQDWVEVMKMPGCGIYAAQSYQIFVQNQRPSEPISDHKLQWYMENRYEAAGQVDGSQDGVAM